MKYLLFVLAICCSQWAWSDFKVEVVTDQLRQPWGLASLPDGRFLVTEKRGLLKIVDQAGQVSPPINGLPDIAEVGQGGLLDVALHPQFSENQWVYLSYVAGRSGLGYSTEVARARLQGAELKDLETIFVAQPKTTGGRHFGSRLVFDQKGYLFISLGDRGRREEAQNLANHIGSLIRLHDDGRVPTDNPFVDQADAKPEIYSFGHRNIQGLALDSATDQVWAHEHGPQGGDELNQIAAGSNYGWPVITYGAEYGTGFSIGEGTKKAGMKQPVYYWDPSIAPSGLAILQGDFYIGALKYQLLARLQKAANNTYSEKRFLEGEFGRIRDVKRPHAALDDNKTLYLLTDARQGKLIRLRLP